jgi:hypothetical protein
VESGRQSMAKKRWLGGLVLASLLVFACRAPSPKYLGAVSQKDFGGVKTVKISVKVIAKEDFVRAKLEKDLRQLAGDILEGSGLKVVEEARPADLEMQIKVFTFLYLLQAITERQMQTSSSLNDIFTSVGAWLLSPARKFTPLPLPREREVEVAKSKFFTGIKLRGRIILKKAGDRGGGAEIWFENETQVVTPKFILVPIKDYARLVDQTLGMYGKPAFLCALMEIAAKFQGEEALYPFLTRPEGSLRLAAAAELYYLRRKPLSQIKDRATEKKLVEELARRCQKPVTAGGRTFYMIRPSLRSYFYDDLKPVSLETLADNLEYKDLYWNALGAFHPVQRKDPDLSGSPEFFIPLLRDKNADVRWQAAMALGELGGPRQWSP